ncbi:MAG: EAL domain-containing protein [Pseudomonadota bacterium]
MSAEEDLMAFCRRLIRTPYQYLAITVQLAAFTQMRGNSRLIRLQQGLIHEMANRYRGQYFRMSNGDAVFVIRSDMIDQPKTLIDEIVTSILRDPDVEEKKVRKLVEHFPIPDQYPDFREHINAYLKGGSLAKLPSVLEEDDEEPDVELEGSLNAAMLGRIEYLINRCEIRPFLKKQDIFINRDNSGWWPVFEERFVSLADLKRKLFPEVDIRPSDPLFNQLCRLLDERLLHYLVVARTRITHKISVNISLDTVFDKLFDMFAQNLQIKERENLVFEIHRGEIFQDIARAVEAITKLHKLGFGVAIDGMTLDLLPYVRLNKLNTEIIKIHLFREHVALLQDDECVKALRQLPPEKIVFSRCDHEGAIKVGQAMGIQMYQGWLIDEQAAMSQSANA